MKKSLIKMAVFSLLAVAVAVAPSRAMAEGTSSTNSVDAPVKKKRDTAPFHGKVSAIDKTAMTVTVGKTTYEVTSETKVFNGDKPGTLADATVGEEAGGNYKKTADGKKVALKITFGSKGEAGMKPKEETTTSDKK